MLQGCLTALRHQVWPTCVGGGVYHVAIRTARRKHLRIAARKKRELENRNKAKEKIVEKGFVPYKIRLMQQTVPKARTDDQMRVWYKTPPQDDVWLQRYYMKRVCTLAEAVSFHREAFHPSVLNVPDAAIQLDVELDMKLEKTKFMEAAKGIVLLPHIEDDKVLRSVVAICKTPEDQAKALEAGAEVAGSSNIVTAIEKGDLKIDSFDYLVSHLDSVTDVLKLRGVLKKKMPDKKRGTIGTDMTSMVRLFARGTEYQSTKEWGQLLYGNILFDIGRLDMEDAHLQENVQAFVKSLVILRPQEYGPFITKCTMQVNGSSEKFVVDLSSYVPKAVPKSKKSKVKGDQSEAKTVSAASEDEEGERKVAVG